MSEVQEVEEKEVLQIDLVQNEKARYKWNMLAEELIEKINKLCEREREKERKAREKLEKFVITQ